MNTKTFTDPTNDSNELIVDKSPTGKVRLTTDSRAYTGVLLAPSDAPALALAILEAAGVVHHDPDDTPYEKSERTENMGALNMSAFYLAKHVNDAEKAEFLAKAQAELEAEALELFKASGAYGSDRFFLKFSDLEETTQSAWLAVARRAREINKEEK